MTVRIRTSLPRALTRSAPTLTRRGFIYPHRSVRAMRVSPSRSIVALLTVALLTAIIIALAHPLLNLHNQLCLAILQVSGIPISGVLPVQLFAGIAGAPVPVIAVPELSRHPIELWVMVTGAVLVLLEVHRRI